MSTELISKIVNALDELEGALATAKDSIKSIDTDDSMIKVRIESYQEILRRQRTLVHDLSVAMHTQNWGEVSRLGELVRGSSLMIKVDAGYILNWLKNPADIKDTEEYQA
jgi:chromosome segregation ATPase